jgi:hypothetical protein
MDARKIACSSGNRKISRDMLVVSARRVQSCEANKA